MFLLLIILYVCIILYFLIFQAERARLAGIEAYNQGLRREIAVMRERLVIMIVMIIVILLVILVVILIVIIIVMIIVVRIIVTVIVMTRERLRRRGLDGRQGYMSQGIGRQGIGSFVRSS